MPRGSGASRRPGCCSAACRREWDQRVGRGTRSEPFVKGPLCADVDGFSLHAAVRVEARDRDRLEHPCGYAGRAAIAENRLSELPDGRVAYSLKKRWKDGTTHVVMTKQVLMERLCALVPRPRRHLVTYHGVFAPAAGIRRWVVTKVEAAQEAARAGASGAATELVAGAVRAVVGGGASSPAGVSLLGEFAGGVGGAADGSRRGPADGAGGTACWRLVRGFGRGVDGRGGAGDGGEVGSGRSGTQIVSIYPLHDATLLMGQWALAHGQVAPGTT